MNFSSNPQRIRLACSIVTLAYLLSGCASPAIEEANRLAESGRHETALLRLRDASNANSSDKQLHNAYINQRDVTVSYLASLAEAARANGDLAGVQSLLARMEAVAPDNPRVAWLRSEVNRFKRHERLMVDGQRAFDAKNYESAELSFRTVMSEDPANLRAQQMMSRIEEMREAQTHRAATLQLATATKPITLEFKDTALKVVFETLARAAGVNFVFDKDVRGDAKVTLFLRNTTVEEAMRIILGTQQLGYKLLNNNTVMVFPNTQQKQRELLDTVTKTFYLVNADPKQVQTLVRTVAKTRDIFIDERLNVMVVRDTPEVVRMIEGLVQSIDLPDPEVMLEMEVLEVSNNRLDQLGVSFPTTVNFGKPDPLDTSPITSLTGLRTYTANPLAVATLRATRDSASILANPKVRARNREKAHVLLGEKLPVFTTTSTANVGVSASVNYIDVGLKLDIEPQVQLDNDVTIKVALEVSSITGNVTGPQGSSAYKVGTRQATTTLRLKDGETQILAGLINDNETRNAAGVPGLLDLPLAGHLFGTKSHEHDKSEIVLLVTPRIIRNLVRPSVAASLVPAGTEAQPGFSGLQLRDEASTSGIGGGNLKPAGSGEAGSRPNAGASPSANMPQSITGPEEVMPGAGFQVAVRNTGTAPLNAALLVDANLLDIEAQAAQAGRVNVTVPPQGVQMITLRVKPDAAPTETLLTLDSGGASLRLRIRGPGATVGGDVSPGQTPATQPEPTEPPEEPLAP